MGKEILSAGTVLDPREIESIQFFVSTETSFSVKIKRSGYKQTEFESEHFEEWFIKNHTINITRKYIDSVPVWAMEMAEKVTPSVRIFERIDPGLELLETWLTGIGSKGEKDFEKAIAILLHLCGLTSVHVGGEYEQATQKKRTQVYGKTTITIDVIAISPSNEIFLCQCAKEWQENKITNILDTSKDLKMMISPQGIKINPIIFTRLKKNQILESIKAAESRNVRVVTSEDILSWLKEVRRGYSPLNSVIQKLKI